MTRTSCVRKQAHGMSCASLATEGDETFDLCRSQFLRMCGKNCQQQLVFKCACEG